jgi:hypothetical protein
MITYVCVYLGNLGTEFHIFRGTINIVQLGHMRLADSFKHHTGRLYVIQPD